MNKNTALTEHYEELRQRALGRQSSGVIWGLVVLRTKGMASWARAWLEFAAGDIAHMPQKVSASSTSCLASAGDEVVQVLAGMIWALRKEAQAR
jgi:hypothetical protein